MHGMRSEKRRIANAKVANQTSPVLQISTSSQSQARRHVYRMVGSRDNGSVPLKFLNAVLIWPATKLINLKPENENEK